MLPKTYALLVAAVLTSLVPGCGTSEYRPVSGIVTVEGEPLKTGRIKFHPEEGRPASGVINQDGSYSLTTIDEGDGAKPGEYKVTVEAIDSKTVGQRPKSLAEEMAGVGADTQTQTETLIDPKYSVKTTSGLTATVKNSGNSDINFDVTK